MTPHLIERRSGRDVRRRGRACRRRPGLRAAGLALAVLAASLGGCAGEDAAAPTASVRVPAVTVSEASHATVSADVTVSGTLVPREEVLVNPLVSGVEIRNLLVDVGDRVRAGAVLVELDASGAETQLAQADADILRAEASVRQASSQIDSATATRTQAQSSLERSRRLRDSGTIPQSALDDGVAAGAGADANLASARDGLAIANAQATQARAARRQARLELDRTKVLAPVDGLVATRNAQRGAITAPGGEPLFTLIRDGEIELAADIVETDLAGIDPGDAADIVVAGLAPLAGTVRLVSPRVDPRTRLGTVRVALEPPPSGALRAGAFAGGRIVTASRDALVVPATAVRASANGESVTVVADGKVAERAVVAGVLSGQMREIVSGLEPGERVLVRAGTFFRDGDAVTPVLAAVGAREPAATAPDPVDATAPSDDVDAAGTSGTASSDEASR